MGRVKKGTRRASAAPHVFAVVLNWNASEETIACVRSLERSGYPKLDIVVVDNGSIDGSPTRLKSLLGRRHHVLLLEHNGGYAGGNNAGIRFSLDRGAEYVLLLNNDTVVNRGFLDPLIRSADWDENIGVLTGRAFLDGSRSRRYTTGGNFRRWRCNIAPLGEDEAGHEQEITAVSGCFLLVRRRVFEQVGLLNEEFFLYFEDLEFSRRVTRSFRMRYVPESEILHKSGAGTRWAEYSPTYLYYATRNRFIAFREDPAVYRLYVLVFSMINVSAKALILIPGLLSTSRRRESLRRLSALWSGFWDGAVHLRREVKT